MSPSVSRLQPLSLRSSAARPSAAQRCGTDGRSGSARRKAHAAGGACAAAERAAAARASAVMQSQRLRRLPPRVHTPAAMRACQHADVSRQTDARMPAVHHASADARIDHARTKLLWCTEQRLCKMPQGKVDAALDATHAYLQANRRHSPARPHPDVVPLLRRSASPPPLQTTAVPARPSWPASVRHGIVPVK